MTSDWERIDKKTLVNSKYPEYKIVKHEWVNFRDIAYEWAIYKDNKQLYWKKVRGQDKYITIPEEEYNYNTASGFKSLQKAILVADSYIEEQEYKGEIMNSRKVIKSNQQSLFSDNVFDGKIKLHLANDYSPYPNSGDKYVNEQGNLYFYIQAYIPNVKRDKENPGVMIGSIDDNLIYFDENDIGEIPKEVYVDPSFDKELAIKKTVNYSISSVYDYLSTSLPIMKGLNIPNEGCILKQNYKEFAGVGNIFNYFKTVAKKRGDGFVYAKIKVSYSDKPLTARIDSNSLRPAVLLNGKQILVSDKDVDFVAFYFKKLESVTASRKTIKSSKSVCIGFNNDTGDLLWKRDDIYTLQGAWTLQTKRKDIVDKWIKKYNLDTTDTRRLDKLTQEGPGSIPWGLPLVEDKEGRNYNKELASILPGHGISNSRKTIKSSKLPTEKDYQNLVDKLNTYCDKHYGKDSGYGSIYRFKMYKENNMNNDGWGNEYPNFNIYDDEGNLDMFSNDDITNYIKKELKAKGWYPEAAHSSSDFTIAVE